MTECEQTRAAIRARLDGAEPLFRAVFVADHLDGCEDCWVWEAQAIALHNRGQRSTSEVRGARAAAEARQRASSAQWLRYVVGVLAVTEIAFCIAALGFGRPLHTYRELAAADLAFAVGCLAAAVQPRRAFGLFPVAVALGLLLVVTGLRDLVDGVTRSFAESHHLLELAAAVGLVALARTATRPTTV